MSKQYYKLSHLFLPLVIVFFIISRFGYLNLPFYWDEAWSYATAVFDMNDHGLALVPGNGNPELTRGHPLLFYFLSAVWTKLFGTSLMMVHLFPLMISCLMLAAVFFIARAMFDQETSMAATVLFALQSVFLAQSTLLLPEVMLALYTLLTVFAYFRKKWTLFAACSVLLVMTKETGMVLIGTLFFDKLVLERLINSGQKKSGRMLIRELAIMSIPVLAFFIFMILQKIRMGWFLYPGHLNLAILDPHEIVNRIRIFSSKLLFQHGRNILFFSAMAALGYLIFKRSVNKPSAHFLLFSLVFIIFFIAFSSVNFFTTRYLLSVFPFFIIPCSWLIITGLKRKWLKASAVVAFALLFAWCTFAGSRNEQDTSLGYKNTVLLQKQAVNFAEEMHWQQKSIYSAFLMQYYLSIPELGYLNDKAQPFMNISNKTGKEYDLFIFCSNEQDPLSDTLTKRSDLFLIKRFENKTAWVEIFGTRAK